MGLEAGLDSHLIAGGHIAWIIGVVSSATFAGAQAASAQAPDSTYFSASPTSGKAPLIVKFCASSGIGIDFGDGTSGGMGVAPDGTCPRPESAFTTHSYEHPGAYKLKGFPCPGVNAASCGAVAGQANAIAIEVTD